MQPTDKDKQPAYYNEASKRASMKYTQEKLDTVKFRVRKEEKQDLQDTAAAAGTSLRRYIVEAINTKAGREIIGYSREAEE